MDIARSCSHRSRLQGSWRGPACGRGKRKSAGYLSLERSRKVRHLTSFRVDGPLSEERALSSSCILDPLHARIGCFAIGVVQRAHLPLLFSFLSLSLTLLGNVYLDASENSLRFALYRVSERKKGALLPTNLNRQKRKTENKRMNELYLAFS